jgi:hypothetical protein
MLGQSRTGSRDRGECLAGVDLPQDLHPVGRRYLEIYHYNNALAHAAWGSSLPAWLARRVNLLHCTARRPATTVPRRGTSLTLA